MKNLQECFCAGVVFYRSSCLEIFCRKGFLRNVAKFTGKHLCQSLFFTKVAGLRLRPATLVNKRLAQVFSSEFWKIFKNIFFYRTSTVAAFLFNKVAGLKRLYRKCFLRFLRNFYFSIRVFFHRH